MEITAVIIARGGSNRILNKSLLPFGATGDNLITHKIHQLQQSQMIDRIVFGSDSDEMLQAAEIAGAEVYKRSDYFCDEQNCSINEAIKDMCSKFSTDIVIWTHCTNPLLSAKTYDRATQSFLDNYSDQKHDSLLSVVEMHEHLWGKDKKPFNYNPWQDRHPLAKTLPTLYMQDGGIFIQPHANMLENSYFFGKTPYLFCIPDEEFADINTHRDYVIAKALYEDMNHHDL